jgi:hypothetical protein
VGIERLFLLFIMSEQVTMLRIITPPIRHFLPLLNLFWSDGEGREETAARTPSQSRGVGLLINIQYLFLPIVVKIKQKRIKT